MRPNHKTVFFKTIVLSLLSFIILALTFKKIRELFPIPMINNDKLVGFPQYFGYPLYFDTLFFFFLIFLPVLILLLFYLLEKHK